MRDIERWSIIALPLGFELGLRALLVEVVLNLHIVNTSVIRGTLGTQFQRVTGTEAEAIQADTVGVKVVIIIFFLRKVGIHISETKTKVVRAVDLKFLPCGFDFIALSLTPTD